MLVAETFAVSLFTGILNVTLDWNGIPVRLGPVEVPVTVYPPFVLSLVSAVWLGPTWGHVPAYTANLAGALLPLGSTAVAPQTGYPGNVLAFNIPDLARFFGNILAFLYTFSYSWQKVQVV